MILREPVLEAGAAEWYGSGHEKARRRCERPGHGHRRNGNTVTSEENSTTENYEYGEWETVSDRIRRRTIRMPYYPDPDRWEYEITGNWNGEDFTASTVIFSEMIRRVSPEAINEHIRTEFFLHLAREVGKREGDWIRP